MLVAGASFSVYQLGRDNKAYRAKLDAARKRRDKARAELEALEQKLEKRPQKLFVLGASEENARLLRELEQSSLRYSPEPIEDAVVLVGPMDGNALRRLWRFLGEKAS